MDHVVRIDMKKKIPEKKKRSAAVLVVILVTISAASSALDAILADGDLDALQRKAFAQWRTLDHTGKLFGRENLEWLREDGS